MDRKHLCGAYLTMEAKTGVDYPNLEVRMRLLEPEVNERGKRAHGYRSRYATVQRSGSCLGSL